MKSIVLLLTSASLGKWIVALFSNTNTRLFRWSVFLVLLGWVSFAQALTPLTGVTRIWSGGKSSQSFHSCAILSGGGVKCWGLNSTGQLGDGTTTPLLRNTAVDASSLSGGVTAIALGGGHSCALTSGGGVKCWGQNYYGQLGDGTTTDRLTSVDVTDLTSGVTAIALASTRSCALTSGGGVKCWGDNGTGQLGDGTTTHRLTPVDVTGLTSGVTAIALGGGHSCALTSGGGVKCWGTNLAGQLGDGTTIQRNTPGDVIGLTSGVAAVALGSAHSCALTSGGGVKCWGTGNNGQLGDGGKTARLTPVDVSGLTSGVTDIALGGHHSCALTSSGGVKCWGINSDTDGFGAIKIIGQLGDGSTAPQSYTPVDVSGLTSGVTAIALGTKHSCALTNSDGVKCWGWNLYGQLGDNTTSNRSTPVDVLVDSSTLTFNLSLITVGMGNVDSSGTPAGTSCGTDCLTYLDTTAVTLNATPVSGFTFDGNWSCTPAFTSGNTLTANTTCTATFTATTPCATQTEIPIEECNVLVDFYNSTGGPSWSDAATNNWNVTSSPCSWTGVTCSAGTSGNVTVINKNSNNLSGPLPASLSALTSLQYLYLDNNQLTGTIPALPANLQHLNLGHNQLTGTIPALPASLQSLYLDTNQLTGTIPALPANLQSLELGHNQLTGTIPALPASLQSLDLYNNHLTGPIPALPASLIGLGLSDNQLTGTIPALPASLQSLYLYTNQLTGTIPALPTSLQKLSLYDNQLTGIIPALPASLLDLQLYSNQLTGTIPALPASLLELYLNNNQLTGIIPDLRATALAAGTVDLSCNQFTGETGNTATALDPDWKICASTMFADYQSNPAPGETLVFSSLNNYIASLTISKVGNGSLEVKDPIVVGDLTQRFTITSGTAPLLLDDNLSSQTVTIQCTPADTRKVNAATLQLTTNDAKQPTVSYPIVCVNIHQNHAPTDILLSNATIQPENTVDTVIGTLSTIDPIEMVDLPVIDIATTCSLCHDSSRATTPAVHSYTLIDNANGLFKIIGNQLLVAQPLTAVTSYTITVRSTDAGGLSFDKTFTLETSVTNAIYTSLPAPNETIRLSTTSLEIPAQANLVITNTGQAELQVGFMKITGEQANDFQVINPQFPINLAPQGTQTVTLSCLPNQSGLSLATLTLISSDTTLPAPTYPLICALEKSGPAFSSVPLPSNPIKFENSPLGQTVTTDLSIVEIGNETLTIVQAEITGLDVAYFKLSETTFTIANGEPPHVLKIHCTPQVVGQQVATLTLVTNDPTQLVVNYELTCTGISEMTSEIYLSNQAIDENIPGDSFIGRLTTDNVDLEERHQYTLINDSQGKFAVIGDGLYTLPNAVFDFATQDRYLITVRSTNTLGISFTKDFVISINEVKAKIYGQIITDLGDKGSYVTIDSPERVTLSVIIESLPEEIGKMANISMSARWTPIDTNKVITIKRPIRRKPLSEHLELILYTGSLPGGSGIFHVDVSYQLDDGTEVSATNIATLQVRRNRPPTKVMLFANHVGGNSPPETVVGTLQTTDPDKSEWFMYVVMDSKYFMAVGNELRRAYSFPPRFANTDQMPITIRSIDSGGRYIDQTFAIFIEVM